MWIGYIKAQVDYSELLFRYWVPVFLAAELFSFFCGSFGSQSEKLARRIAQTEADLKVLQQESDAITGRVDDPEVPRPLRQTRARKPFPQALPRDEHRLRPAQCLPGHPNGAGETHLRTLRLHHPGPSTLASYRAGDRRTGVTGSGIRACRPHR